MFLDLVANDEDEKHGYSDIRSKEMPEVERSFQEGSNPIENDKDNAGN